MKKQMTEREAEEFSHMLRTEHLASSSISAANPKGAMERIFRLETATSHNWNIAVRGKASDGMRVPLKKD
ncbi:hypothetical protein AV650_28980 (plasmid) [Serratia fonticola]|nr:hypothetical protein AV650_28980 [Serratia fonticola]